MNKNWENIGDPDPYEHFWLRVDIRGPEECWLWTGPPMPTGYGQLRVKGQHHYAHRYAYLATHGEISSGKYIDHTCHNEAVECAGGSSCIHRLCCNPAHLDAVSNQENTERANEPRQRGRFVTECPQGHPYNEANTGWLARRGHKERVCKACKRHKMWKAKYGTDHPEVVAERG